MKIAMPPDLAIAKFAMNTISAITAQCTTGGMVFSRIGRIAPPPSQAVRTWNAIKDSVIRPTGATVVQLAEQP